MWYFTWVLGLAFICAFSILNALWFELSADKKAKLRADNRVGLD